MKQTLEKEVRFDGGESKDSDLQYLESCKAGAVNLVVYKLGFYNGCAECKCQTDCRVIGIWLGHLSPLK